MLLMRADCSRIPGGGNPKLRPIARGHLSGVEGVRFPADSKVLSRPAGLTATGSPGCIQRIAAGRFREETNRPISVDCEWTRVQDTVLFKKELYGRDRFTAENEVAFLAEYRWRRRMELFESDHSSNMPTLNRTAPATPSLALQSRVAMTSLHIFR
jgi:hypothetical protein